MLYRFHPSCMGMTIEEAKKLDHFLCSDCSSENEAKRSLNAFPVSPSAEAKVRDVNSTLYMRYTAKMALHRIKFRGAEQHLDFVSELHRTLYTSLWSDHINLKKSKLDSLSVCNCYCIFAK